MSIFTRSSSTLDQLQPKTAFAAGLITGTLGLCTIGFFVLLGLTLSGNVSLGIGVDGSSERGSTAAARQPNPDPSPSPAAPARPDEDPSKVSALAKDDFVRGAKNPKVTIVEFSDLQCPFCQRFHDTMKQALGEYGSQIAWVYRHFPLDSIHPNARPAAIASECVAKFKGNDGFWKFADKTFANQSGMGEAFYIATAKELGITESKFKDCLADPDMASAVQADYQEGLNAGVGGTPASFVLETQQVISGAQPYEAVQAAIEQALSR